MKKLGLMGVVLMSSSAFAVDGIKLGGFADVGFGWTKDADPASQFAMGTGAFYFGKTVGAGEVLVDLPFAYMNAAASNAIVAGFEQAQVFVSWKYDNGFWWKMGQFDGILGAEASDSADRFFSHTGLLYGNPVTNHGALVGYKASDAMNVSFLVSNKTGAAAQAAGGKFDFGVKVDTVSDAFTASVGAMFTATGPADEYEWTLNAVAGNKSGQLSSTLEVMMANDKAASKTAMGFGGHFEYAVDEGMDFGASVEWMKDASDAKTLELRAGPRWNMNKDFNIRLAYNMTKPDGGTTGQGLSLNAVHKF